MGWALGGREPRPAPCPSFGKEALAQVTPAPETWQRGGSYSEFVAYDFCVGAGTEQCEGTHGEEWVKGVTLLRCAVPCSWLGIFSLCVTARCWPGQQSHFPAGEHVHGPASVAP